MGNKGIKREEVKIIFGRAANTEEKGSIGDRIRYAGPEPVIWGFNVSLPSIDEDGGLRDRAASEGYILLENLVLSSHPLYTDLRTYTITGNAYKPREDKPLPRGKTHSR